jgi:hypothetical protein
MKLARYPVVVCTPMELCIRDMQYSRSGIQLTNDDERQEGEEGWGRVKNALCYATSKVH